jgi:exopolyphosphatase/guanosine-5'-triphosphate,3'-diphosphate pyrophosphatase
MRVAIVDLGTNTFNLLIAEVSKKKFKEIYGTKLPVKLGEGGISKKHIASPAFKRGIAALKTYKRLIDKHKAVKVIAYATSAIREASNGDLFIKTAKKETGIAIKKITGAKEAELIYSGVRQAVSLGNNYSLIMDIGGGSTEFIVGNKKKIIWKKSFLLGAARLIEKFRPSDPIKEPEIRAIETYLLKELKPLLKAVSRYSPVELIGSSGSFESLAEMIAHKFYSPEILEGKTEYLFNLKDCSNIYEMILRSTRSERVKMKGLLKMRVDMIVVSSIFVNLIIQKLNISKLRLSAYSLKEGVIADLINN